MELSGDQRRVVESTSPALLVVAGAGSGKTEVLARRIERLLVEDAVGGRVLALSYTERAANELRERASRRVRALERRVDTRTLHGFAHELVRRYGTRIGLSVEPEVLSREEDRVAAFSAWLTEKGYAVPDSLDTMLADLDLVRAKSADHPYLDLWRTALQELGSLDYPAMLERATELAETPWVGRQVRILYTCIAIDEAQNLTLAQYRFVKALLGDDPDDRPDVIVVGDERQSIVAFAGADRRLMIRLGTELDAERIDLAVNFRSATRIIALGQAIAHQLELPVADNPPSSGAEGHVEILGCRTELDEANAVADRIERWLRDGLPPSALARGESDHVDHDDIAVLARSAAHLRAVRTELVRREIPRAVASTPDGWVTSYTARALRLLVAHLAAPEHRSTRRALGELAGAAGHDDGDIGAMLAGSEEAGVRAAATLAAAASVEQMISFASALSSPEDDWPADRELMREAWEDFLSLEGPDSRTFGNFNLHLFRTQRGDLLAPGVRLLTVHKAQGREFRAVVVVGCNKGQFPDFRAATHEQQLDELRTFYVAVSRASRILLLTRAEQRQTRYGPRPTEPSPFLSLVGEGTASSRPA